MDIGGPYIILSPYLFRYCKGVRIGCGEWYCLGSKVESCGARCPDLLPLDPRVRVSDTRTECGTQVDFSCPKCYQALPEDSTTAECLFNGTWTAQPPRCTHVTCRAPDTPQNGQVFRLTGEIIRSKYFM